jgi:hypothetical protein
MGECCVVVFARQHFPHRQEIIPEAYFTVPNLTKAQKVSHNFHPRYVNGLILSGGHNPNHSAISTEQRRRHQK